ncbi:MAG: RluA family pseudouridine synthase [Planctomycetota bacterium]|jgi:23S rRNA pseudouridine1911/1915/1917 synthase|nr:MAG: RluA family pseudouridine synthase [Planctomycetota bacterium]
MIQDPISITVPLELVGKTVLAVMRVAVPGESWSKLRQRLERLQVSVNGAVCENEAHRVAVGDEIILHTRPVELPKQSDVQILFIDPHLVVVAKPSGMMTHRRPEERTWSAEKKGLHPSLEEAVASLIARRSVESGQRARNSHPRVPVLRIVHRLDRDTSGLLVLARSPEAEEGLIGQFRRHTAHRVYWTIVHGHPAEETIESNLVRDRGDGRRGSINNPKVGQRAVTHVRPLEDLGAYSLVECQLETGRTNQIRIHLSERGHLVCGDVKYRQPFAAKMIDDQSHAPRLALHAAELGFVHPISGEELQFRMPLPQDLAAFLDHLRFQAHSNHATRQ